MHRGGGCVQRGGDLLSKCVQTWKCHTEECRTRQKRRQGHFAVLSAGGLRRSKYLRNFWSGASVCVTTVIDKNRVVQRIEAGTYITYWFLRYHPFSYPFFPHTFIPPLIPPLQHWRPRTAGTRWPSRWGCPAPPRTRTHPSPRWWTGGGRLSWNGGHCSQIYHLDHLFSITLYWSPILRIKLWIAVLLPIKVAAIFKRVGGMSHTAVLMLFGIHSANPEAFLFCTSSILSSTSLIDILPRNTTATVRYLT